MKSELAYLRVSFWVNLLIAAVALTLVGLARSLAVLFDGMYALIACLMTAVSVKVVSLLSRPDDAKYPFGYQNYEPLIVGIRGLIVLAVALNTLFSSIKAVMSGGRIPEFGFVAAYGIFAAVASLMMAMLARKTAKETGSKIMHLEERNWRIGGILSLVVALAFVGGAFTEGVVKYYFDPVITIVMVLSILPIPSKIIYRSFRQLLFVAPSREVQEIIRARYQTIPQDERITQMSLRLTRVGRVVYAHLTAVLSSQTSVTIGELDTIRDRIEKAIVAKDSNTFCDVIFTSRSNEPASLSI